MRYNYFEYNNVKYYTGTEIKMLPFNRNYGNEYSDGYYFLYCNDEYDWYVYEKNGHKFVTDSKGFWERFGEVTGKVDETVHIPEKKRLKDWQINGLMTGWVIYISALIFGIIFKDFIQFWIIASLIFFSWRKNKIDKEGYYVE